MKENILKQASTLTFDCYGTLIDWETGLRRAIGQILHLDDPARLEDVFAAYLKAEARIEAGPYQSYRRVVALAVADVCASLNTRCSNAQAEDVADSVGDWPAFADTGASLSRLACRFRLGILSNVDRDLLARTLRRFPVTLDFVVTAADVRSYKPAFAHFEQGRRLARGPMVHVAQSLYHDGAPARELGLPFVWINRRGESLNGPATPTATFPDLATWVEVADDGAMRRND